LKNKNVFSSLKIIGLLIVPLILIILPSNFFDQGKSLCLSVLLLDKTCFGCGITRAIQHLIHLDFEAAWRYNKISFIVLPILIVLWAKEIRKNMIEIKLQKRAD
jgi:Protein of unknown function (DUF2752)